MHRTLDDGNFIDGALPVSIICSTGRVGGSHVTVDASRMFAITVIVLLQCDLILL